MRKKITLLLILMVTMGTGVWADEEKDYVASITKDGTTTSYTTITDALTAVASAQKDATSDVTITLLADCSYNATSYTILNIGILTPNDTHRVYFVGGDHTLTLSGKVYINFSGRVTMQSGTIKFANSSTSYCVTAQDLEMTGGTIDASGTSNNALTSDTNSAKININGGTIKGGATKGYAIYNNSSSLTLTKGLLSGGSGVYYDVNDKPANTYLGTGSCFATNSTSATDGYEYIAGNTTPLTNQDVLVLQPEASTVVGEETKVYNTYSNAWNAVNKDGTTSTVYILKDVTTPDQMQPSSGTNITLIGGDHTLTYSGTGKNNGWQWCGMFYLYYLDSRYSNPRLTILSGKYVSKTGDCFEKMGNFPLYIEGGEFSTQGNNKHTIYGEEHVSPFNVQITGGIFHYTYSYGNYYGGFQAPNGFSLSSCIPTGYTVCSYTEGGSDVGAKVLRSSASDKNYTNPFAVKVCDHEGTTSTTSCSYCGAAVTAVASIGSNNYTSFEAAFAAVTEGQTIKMLADCKILDDTYYSVDKNITIDLDGHAITGNMTKQELISGLFHVTAGKVLTVSGTSGSITNNNATHVAISLASDGTKGGGVTIANTLTPVCVAANNNSNFLGNVDTLTVNSGTVTIPANADVTIAKLAFNEGSLIVRGGTFTQTSASETGLVMEVYAGTFYFDPTEYTIATSSITHDGSIWTVAADAVVAHVTTGSTTTRHASIEDAVTTANGTGAAATITLYKDVTSSSEVTMSNSYGTTFEGGEYKWTVEDKVIVASGAKMILNNGTLYCTRAKGVNSFKLMGSFEMNGGTIESVNNSGMDISSSSAELTITAGTIKSNSGHAIYAGADIQPSKMSLSGGIYIPESSNAAIYVPNWASNYNVNILLVTGYDFYAYDTSTSTVGSAISAEVKALTAGQAVTVKPATEFTSGNVKYTVTGDITAATPTYTVVASGFETAPTENTSLTIPSSVTDQYNSRSTFTVTGIGERAFKDKTHLTGVTFPSTLTSIGEQAFDGTQLTEVTIPENVTYIGTEAFQTYNGTSTLKTINYNAKKVTSTYTSSSYPFWTTSANNSVLTAINIGANVESIPDYMFYRKNNAGLVVTSNAATAPMISTNTFGGYQAQVTKQIATLKTPNATTSADVATYLEWGFTNYSPTLTELALSDTYKTLIAGTYTAGNITYTRTGLTSGNYGSFALPFNYTVGTNTTGIEKAYQPIGISILDEDNMLSVYFNEVTDVTAGYPVLALINAENATFASNTQTEISTNTAGVETQNTIYKKTGVGELVARNTDYLVKFGGTFVKLTNTDKPGLETFNTNGSFGSASYVNPFRAYFTKTQNGSDSKNIIINAIFGEGATGINMIMSDDGTLTPVTGEIYDLNGRSLGTNVKSLPRGTYIINGKKTVK